MYVQRDTNNKIIGQYANLQLGYAEEFVADDSPELGPTLAEKQSTKWEEIKVERDRLKFNGVFVSDKWIHTDTYSRTQWMGMVMMGASLPVVPWTTMDGTTINTTPALASAVFQAVAAQDIAIFTAAATHRAQMIASSDPLSYDFSTGWPATYVQ